MRRNNRGLLAYIPYLLAVIIMFSMFGNLNSTVGGEVGYKALNEIIEKENIETVEIIIDGLTVKISGKYKSGEGSKVFTSTIVNNEEIVSDFVNKLNDKQSLEDFQIVDGSQKSVWLDLAVALLPMIVTFGILGWLMSKMSGGAGGVRQQMDVVKSKAKIQTDIKTKFSDVAGAKEEKEEVQELIDYLQNPRKFEEMGARIPKGILLVGPATSENLVFMSV